MIIRKLIGELSREAQCANGPQLDRIVGASWTTLALGKDPEKHRQERLLVQASVREKEARGGG